MWADVRTSGWQLATWSVQNCVLWGRTKGGPGSCSPLSLLLVENESLPPLWARKGQPTALDRDSTLICLTGWFQEESPTACLALPGAPNSGLLPAELTRNERPSKALWVRGPRSTAQRLTQPSPCFCNALPGHGHVHVLHLTCGYDPAQRSTRAVGQEPRCWQKGHTRQGRPERSENQELPRTCSSPERPEPSSWGPGRLASC